MQEPKVIVVGPRKEPEVTAELIAQADDRRIPSEVAPLFAASLFGRGAVKRALRRKRLEAHPIVPGGGTRERARRLRQMARERSHGRSEA